MNLNMMQKGQIEVAILLLLVIVGFFGVVFYAGGLTFESPPLNPIIVTETPKPSPAIVDETANWKTYTNTQYKYQISYPNSWKLDREEKETKISKSLVQLSKNNPQTLSNFIIKVEPKTYEAVFNELKESSSRYKGNMARYKLGTINARKAVSITGAGDSDYLVDIIFENNSTVFHIVASFTNSPSGSDLSQFDQILSTFKFIQ